MIRAHIIKAVTLNIAETFEAYTLRKVKEYHMATIKEIAALAGVSRGTVDRVLNNRGSVNANTAKKIEEIAKALDYRPNKAGLVLAASKKRLKLGVIIFSAENPFFSDVLDGINSKAEELSEYNCSVLVKQIPINTEAQLKAINELVDADVNGIALAPCNDNRIRLRINELFEQGIPVVTLNTDIENAKRLAYVGSHYTKSGATAAGLLRLMTSSEVFVGILTGSSDILCHTERIAGFSSTLAPVSDRIHIVSVVETHDDEIESYEKTLALLNTHPEINALFFAAGGVYGGCRAVCSRRLGNRLKIIAYDKAETTEQFLRDNVLSAVICQQPHTQGKKPLDILFTYLTTGEKPADEYYYTAVDIRILENI